MTLWFCQDLSTLARRHEQTMRMQIVQERQAAGRVSLKAQQRGKGTGGRWDPMDFELGGWCKLVQHDVTLGPRLFRLTWGNERQAEFLERLHLLKARGVKALWE